jgi:hypothetical protein
MAILAGLENHCPPTRVRLAIARGIKTVIAIGARLFGYRDHWRYQNNTPSVIPVDASDRASAGHVPAPLDAFEYRSGPGFAAPWSARLDMIQ